MNFIKMHGLGNDFIVIDTAQETLPADISEFARFVCDRRFGVGGDGLILVMPSDKADIRMRIINSDGSEPEMCGNGIRCIAILAYEKAMVSQPEFTVETLAGILKPKIVFNNEGTIKGVRVDMGEPHASAQEIIAQPLVIENKIYDITCVSMGNPHCAIFVEDTENTPVTIVGPMIETHDIFPKKTNVEFIEVLNPKEVKMRVWERGAGETLACGTGACATAVACVLNNKTERTITVHLRGGDLEIEWAENNHVFMTGPATKVYEGKLY